ncbi:MAG: AAA family ATPase [bacterium]|nr:AAA family ATPase [bacterium]
MTQKDALNIMKSGVNVYLTGSAGSGKTHLLNQYISYLQEHDINVAVTASTGIAATHMNGMTIHGWAGIGIREKLDKYDLEALEEKKYLHNRFSSARVLIIDEVSMLHAHRLDMVDEVCKKFKRNMAPFGGLQVILAGDLFQLPPINKSGELKSKDMIIYSRVWGEMKPAICYLTEQHRQEDDKFLNILNAIRDDSINEDHFELLASRHNANLGENIKPTKLYTHNKNVDAENNLKLAEIDDESKVYEMTSSGHDVMVDILKKSCLAGEKLFLKKGAEVMFIKNNLEEGYVNGTRGIVDGFNSMGLPVVRLSNSSSIHTGKKIEVATAEWVIEENSKTKAKIMQIPLRLAWAITIHKSQGMSLDNAEIDLSHTFAYGMGYVALSRVRTLAGVRLVGFNPNALIVDPEVLKFDKELRTQSIDNEQLFSKLKTEEQDKLEHNFILRMDGSPGAVKVLNKKTKKFKKIPTIEITKEYLEKGMSIKNIANERGLTEGTIIGHIEDIVAEFPETIITHLRPIQTNIDIVKKINHKLKDDMKGKLTPLKFALEREGSKMSFEAIRIVRLFI